VGAGLAYEKFLARFLQTPLGVILASNALDGEDLGLHGLGVSKEILRDAYRAGGDFEELRHAEFVRLIEDIILGRKPPSRDYAARLASGCHGFDRTKTLAVVWPFDVLPRLASAADHRRFSRLTGAMRAPGSDWLRQVASLPAEARYFRPAPRAKFGQSFVWFTSTSNADHYVTSRPNETSPADALRDALGMHQQQPATPQSQLVVLHLPFALLDRLRTARPCFAMAGSHHRFAVRAHDGAEGRISPLGRAVHLGRFADGELRSGAPVRVAMAFSGADFNQDEVVRFDVLGPVTVARGQHHSEDHAAFARALRGRRTDQQLLARLS